MGLFQWIEHAVFALFLAIVVRRIIRLVVDLNPFFFLPTHPNIYCISPPRNLFGVFAENTHVRSLFFVFPPVVARKRSWKT